MVDQTTPDSTDSTKADSKISVSTEVRQHLKLLKAEDDLESYDKLLRRILELEAENQ